jgi:hypothetical protein
VITLAVTNTGKQDVIIGFDWLCRHNLTIDWTRKTILLNRCPNDCFRCAFRGNPDEEIREDFRVMGEGVGDNDEPLVLEEGDRLFVTRIYNEEYLKRETERDEEEMRRQWRREAGIGEYHQKQPRSIRDIEDRLRR